LEGHRLLQRAGLVGGRERFVRREVYDYGRVLHDLQLNAWVLGYRRAAGDAFRSWEGRDRDRATARSQATKRQIGSRRRVVSERVARREPQGLETGCRARGHPPDRGEPCLPFVEYDRTSRVDKNFEKLRRDDTFLCWWISYTAWADGPLPYVVLVCQDGDQRERLSMPPTAS
jgi:hypothetical protein